MKRVNNVVAILLGALFILGNSTTAFAGGGGSGDLSAEASLAYHTAYVWRGQVLNDESVLDPSLTTTFGDWSFNTWGSFDLTDNHKKEGEFAEIDLTLSYAVPLDGPVGVELGCDSVPIPSERSGLNKGAIRCSLS